MVEINNKTRSKIDIRLIYRISKKFLERYKIKKKNISIALVGDVMMRRLNKSYRQVDRVTDILAFPGEGDDLGEIIIDWAQIKRQAAKYAGSARKELAFILVHGLLHLLGHEDKTKEGMGEMERLGEKFIEFLNNQGYKL